MDTIFKQRQYLTPIERESVASTVGLSPQQVRVWFQNRRQKAKQFLAYKQHQQNGQDVAQNEEETSSGNNGEQVCLNKSIYTLGLKHL